MDTTNGFEQAQVRPPQALLVGNRDDHVCTRVNGLMYGMAQAWDEAASGALLGDSMAGKCVPLLISLREMARDGCQHASEKKASVLCDAEAPRATRQPGRR